MIVLVFDTWDKVLHGSEVWQHGVYSSMACTATHYIIGLATQYRYGMKNNSDFDYLPTRVLVHHKQNR
jgi:hypothetical protein